MEQEERLTRIENVLGTLSDKTNRLDDVMLVLAESHIKLTNHMDTLTGSMDTLTHRMDTLTHRVDTLVQVFAERDQKNVQEFKDLDQRIGALVSAIGEFIRNKPATG